MNYPSLIAELMSRQLLNAVGCCAVLKMALQFRTTNQMADEILTSFESPPAL